MRLGPNFVRCAGCLVDVGKDENDTEEYGLMAWSRGNRRDRRKREREKGTNRNVYIKPYRKAAFG